MCQQVSIHFIKNPAFKNVSTDIPYALTDFQIEEMIVDHFNYYYGAPYAKDKKHKNTLQILLSRKFFR